MSIQDVINNRGIEEVVHFTTHHGLIGILDSKYLKARDHLHEDQRLEFILKPNSKFRSDPAWTKYVNLSISRINKSFFNYCSRWHNDIHWCALSFSPSILQDDGVVFTTTNNIYRTSVIRASGEAGLEGMFAPSILGKNGALVTRSHNPCPSFTTDIEAEVLYPQQVSIDHLQRIIVPSEDALDEICGVTHALNCDHLRVDLDSNFF